MRLLSVLWSLMLGGAATGSYAQRAYTVKIFQYEGTDSLHKELAMTRRFDAQGQMAAEICHRNYLEGPWAHMAGQAHFWVYKDTLLMKYSSISHVRDSTKSIFTYNDKGQRTAARFFHYSRKLKPGVDKGLTRPGGCILLTEDFEPNRTWQDGGSCTYQYDAFGRCISYNEPHGYATSKQWTYDHNGRHIRYISMRDSMLLSQKKWRYNGRGRLRKEEDSDGAGFTETFYFYDWRGRLKERVVYLDSVFASEAYYTYRKCLRLQSGTYKPRFEADTLLDYSKVQMLDSKGRLVEEVDYAGDCPLETKKLIRYYPDGRVAQTILFTCRDNSRLVHDYVYE